MNHNLSLPKNTNKMVTIAGLGLVLLAGVGFTPAGFPEWILPMLGAILGLLGVKDSKSFLLAGLSLYAAHLGLEYLPFVGGYASHIARAMLTFIAPAMLIVSLRSIYDQINK